MNELPAFFRSGGQMGALTQTYHWQHTSLGPPQHWPPGLRTTLGLLLHSAVPMGLFWGPDRLCFYNDAFRPLLDRPGASPSLGQRAADVLPRQSGLNGALIEQVMTTGELVQANNQPVSVHDGNPTGALWGMFSYSPAFTEAGQVEGVLITFEGREAAPFVSALHQSEQRFQNLVRDAAIGIIVLLGDEYRVAIVNDAYARLIDRGRQELLDQPLFAVIPETKAVFQPLMDQVLTSGKPLQLTGQPYFVYVDGQKKDGFLDLVYQPYREENGAVAGVMVLCHDVTEQKKAEQEAARFKYMADNARDPFMLMRQDGSFAYLNQLALDRWGYTADDAAHLRVSDIDPIHNEVRFRALFDSLQKTPVPPFETLHQRRDNAVFPVEVGMNGLLLDGQPHVFAVARDISERKKVEQALRASEQRFQGAIEAVQGVLWTNNARGQMEGLQPGWAALTGQTYDEYQGYGWASVVHPDDAQPTVEAWHRAVATQQPFIFEHRVRLSTGNWGIFTVRAIPLLDADRNVKEWVGVHTDLTEQRRAEDALRTSEAKLRSVVDNAPVAFGLLVGPEYRIESLNQAFRDLTGIPADSLGKPVADLFTRSMANGQPLLDRLDRVYTTGLPVQSPETPIDIVRNGVTKRTYCSFSYIPLFDTSGAVYAIADVGVDVTEQVLARQKIEKTEASLRGAVDLAQLATWSLDILTGQVDYSNRFTDWLGLSEGVQPIDTSYALVPGSYQQRVREAIDAVLQPGASGLYDNEHPIINQRTGQQRIIHVQAQVFYDTTGKPTSLSGTAQDVTMQRELQSALEQQVQERTDQLATANEELAALNQELTARNQELTASSQETIVANEKLAESNHNLTLSNANLQQFAYVASHDLQEPLRKIQQFGDLLKSQYADQLGDGLNYLGRMQSAASRMSTLIKDLLSFSRLSVPQLITTMVDLNAVLDMALTDLEVRIEETAATIDRAQLPVVRGNASQLGQLFTNLVSNALKFSTPGKPPVVQVTTRLVRRNELPPSVRPARTARNYHCLEITDNGIGFDARYVDRIFQVFQRLHSQSEFVGTGIGLAICEKVAANHGGAITAVSQPGEGATFQVYLPA